MTEAYLLLGSNEGNRIENLQNATRLLDFRCGKVVRSSGIYETDAWGMKDQPAFLNQALIIKTRLSPINLLSTLKLIEREVGRQETIKWGPRVIDIDILFIGEQILESPELTVPHPLLQERRFTLLPLAEIAPTLRHPKLDATVAELLQRCTDTGEVAPFRRAI